MINLMEKQSLLVLSDKLQTKGEAYGSHLATMLNYKSDDLLGQQVTVMAESIIYAGVTIYDNHDFFELTNVTWIYDTGDHESKDNLEDSDVQWNARIYHHKVHSVDFFTKRVGKSNKESSSMDLTGKRAIFITESFYYEGDIIGECFDYFYLENPIIIYTIGAWDRKSYEDANKLPYLKKINKSCIESIILGSKGK